MGKVTGLVDIFVVVSILGLDSIRSQQHCRLWRTVVLIVQNGLFDLKAQRKHKKRTSGILCLGLEIPQYIPSHYKKTKKKKKVQNRENVNLTTIYIDLNHIINVWPHNECFTCKKKSLCVMSWISSSETSSGKNLALNLNCRGFSFFTSCWVTWET